MADDEELRTMQIKIPGELIDRLEDAARERLVGRNLLVRALLEDGLARLIPVEEFTLTRPRETPEEDRRWMSERAKRAADAFHDVISGEGSYYADDGIPEFDDEGRPEFDPAPMVDTETILQNREPARNEGTEFG